MAATKVKVIELAKELGVTSKDLMRAAEEMGHKGVRAMTPHDPQLANSLRLKLGKGRERPEEPKPKRVAKPRANRMIAAKQRGSSQLKEVASPPVLALPCQAIILRHPPESGPTGANWNACRSVAYRGGHFSFDPSLPEHAVIPTFRTPKVTGRVRCFKESDLGSNPELFASEDALFVFGFQMATVAIVRYPRAAPA